MDTNILIEIRNYMHANILHNITCHVRMCAVKIFKCTDVLPSSQYTVHLFISMSCVTTVCSPLLTVHMVSE